MAWIAPKTNWIAGEGVRHTDMNRIEGNSLDAYNLVQALPSQVATANATLTSLQNYMNSLKPVSFSLSTSAWGSNTSIPGYKYRAAYSISGLVATSRVDVSINTGYIMNAIKAGVFPGVEVYAGGIYFYTRDIPASVIAGTYVIFKAVI